MPGSTSLPELRRPACSQPLGEPYRPYRSVAAWYCWRAVDDAFMSG